MMTELSPLNTPKRKRGGETKLSPIKFSFDPSANPDPDDEGNSPRTKVAHKFSGLALESGGGAASDDSDLDVQAADLMRKRQRADGETMAISQPVDGTGSEGRMAPAPEFVVRGGEATEAAQLGGALHRAYPSINRLSDSKSRAKKRSGTPPLRLKKPPLLVPGSEIEDEGVDETEIVDPVRAALTWHDDEITMYDPEDEDDDGTGINGIGFRPTPALAHARAMKRKQQMAEYRKREESEARARRSQRRRGGPEITLDPGEKSPTRKVRFTDAESQGMAIKTWVG